LIEIGDVLLIQKLGRAWNSGDDDLIFLEHAAYPKWVLRFVLRAVRNFVIERAKALRSVTMRGGTRIANRETEDFSERVFRLLLICHARKDYAVSLKYSSKFQPLRNFVCRTPGEKTHSR
jgi:hypothetical protein